MAEMEMPVAKGKYRGAIIRIDEEDYDLVQGYGWCVSVSGDKRYATAQICLPNGRKKTIKMHRLILGAPPGFDVDHWDRDGLNNTRANLRLATRTQNNANARKREGSLSSQYKGVCWHKVSKKWMVEIKDGGRRFYLGLFASEREAALSYDCAARRVFGEFCRLNFPDVSEYSHTFEELTTCSKSSRYKGVSYYPKNKNWTASISRNGERRFVRGCRTEEEAHEATLRLAQEMSQAHHVTMPGEVA